MKVAFKVVEGEIEEFVDNLKTHKYIWHGTKQGGKRKGEPRKRRVILKYKDLSELEILEFIKNQKYRCILKFDRDHQAFGENLLLVNIYNSDIE